MQCTNCGVSNDADSKFCKECGQKVEQSDGHVRIGELIYAAYKSREEGNLEDAILACQGALALNESSASAHALLGSLYEMKGDVSAAVREYERVLELNPGSEADLRKLEDLKAGRVTLSPVSAPSHPLDRFRPFIPHITAAVLFLFVLGIGLVWSRGPAEKSVDADTSTPQPLQAPMAYGNYPPGTTMTQPYGQYPYGQTGTGQTQQQTDAEEQEQQQTASNGRNAPHQSNPAPPAQNQAGQNTGANNNAPQPVLHPLSPINPQQGAAPSPAVRPAGEPPVIVPIMETPGRPAQDQNRPTQPAPAPTATPAPRPPVITHTPAPAPAPAPVVDPEQRAAKAQSEGRYQDAVNAYREALSKTSDPGRIHQQIAICQQRLGQHDNAVDSYTSAIRAYREQSEAGRDAAKVQRNIRACEAGIQVNRNRK